jgi:hypothetical protein
VAENGFSRNHDICKKGREGRELRRPRVLKDNVQKPLKITVIKRFLYSQLSEPERFYAA